MRRTIRRRAALGLIGGLVAACPFEVLSEEQRVRKIGILVLQDSDGEALSRELRKGLSSLGYHEGQNIEFEQRSAGGQSARLAGLAADLVHDKVDVVVALYTPCALAAKKETSEIPIVAAAMGDPVGTDLVVSLPKPGGNVTGMSNMGAETAGKAVELLQELLPSLHRVAALVNPTDPFTKSFLEQIKMAGQMAGIEIRPVATAKGNDELDIAFATIASERAEGVVVGGIFFPKAVADLAIKHGVPTASVLRSFVEAGGLLSYGANLPALFRRTAVFVDKILKGTKPADLPVEQPTKFELIINLKTAKALGLTIPESLLSRADDVIE